MRCTGRAQRNARATNATPITKRQIHMEGVKSQGKLNRKGILFSTKSMKNSALCG
jgi:hypothetical protein